MRRLCKNDEMFEKTKQYRKEYLKEVYPDRDKNYPNEDNHIKLDANDNIEKLMKDSVKNSITMQELFPDIKLESDRPILPQVSSSVKRRLKSS